MLLSYKPIWVSYGAMHLSMFLSTAGASLGQFAYFILHLSARPFLGSVRKAAPPPVCLLPILARLASSHYYFYKVYLNTLDICLRWILSYVWYGRYLEGSALFLRVLFFFDVSNVFGGVPMWSVNILIVLTTFYEMELRRCCRTCWMYPCKLD